MDAKTKQFLFWVGVFFSFCVGLWPVGLFFGLRKLLKNKPDFSQSTRSSAASSPAASYTQTGSTVRRVSTMTEEDWEALKAKLHQQGTGRGGSSRSAAGVRTGTATAATGQTSAGNTEKKHRLRSGRGLRIVGAVLVGFFGVIGITTFLNDLNAGYSLLKMIAELNPFVAFVVLGVVLFVLGMLRSGRSKRLKRYLALMGNAATLDLRKASEATGIEYQKVISDLQHYVDTEEEGHDFLDVARGIYVRDARSYIRPEPKAEPAEEPARTSEAKETAGSDNDMLQQIRAVNERIHNPEINAKVDEIGMLTAKIFRLVDEDPEKEQEIRSFTSYYLPQTLKILDAYARMEEKGAGSKNIDDAKAKIDSMLDKLVAGYSSQLDRLFGPDVLDITSDIAVMEQMLARDGLLEDPFAAAAEETAFELTL